MTPLEVTLVSTIALLSGGLGFWLGTRWESRRLRAEAKRELARMPKVAPPALSEVRARFELRSEDRLREDELADIRRKHNEEWFRLFGSAPDEDK